MKSRKLFFRMEGHALYPVSPVRIVQALCSLFFLFSLPLFLLNCDDEKKKEPTPTPADTRLIAVEDKATSPLVASSKDQVLLGFSVTTNVTVGISKFIVNFNEGFQNKLVNVRLISSTDDRFSTGGNNTLLTNVKDSINTAITININNAVDGNSNLFFFLVADVNTKASSQTPQLSIQVSTNNFTFTSGSFSKAANLSSQFAFKEKSNVLTLSKLNSVTPGPLNIGSINAAVLGFSAMSQLGTTLTGFTLQSSAKTFGRLNRFRLVRSIDDSYLTTTDNVEVPNVKIDTANTQIKYSQLNETLTSSAKNYFVVADVGSAPTLTSSTIQLTLSSNNVVVSSGSIAPVSIVGTLYSFVIPPPEPGAVYFGVVGFNNDVKLSPLSKDGNVSKTFINGLTNTVDATALCYGMKKGLDLLQEAADNPNLPVFDYSYLVTFTDGFDNYSSTYLPVFQDQVVSYTKNLVMNAKIDNQAVRSYTLGFQGAGVIREQDLIDLASPSGYSLAVPATLEAKFKEIANKVLSTSKNVSIVTNAVPISRASPKYMKITVTATTSSAATPPASSYSNHVIEGLLYNEDSKSPIFEVNVLPAAVTFDAETINGIKTIKGTLGDRAGVNKAIIPLKNLSVKAANQELFITKIVIEIKYKTDKYSEDVEDSRIEDPVAKNIAVVLVLDCSLSLGNTFGSVKTYSVNFINSIINR